MIREALSSVARNESLGGILSRTPVAKDVVKRIVGGDTVDSALAVAAELADLGYVVSLERAAPNVTTAEQADAVATEYEELVDAVAEAGLSGVCEATVFPEALGLLAEDQQDAARARLEALARASAGHGVALMVGTGPADDVATTLDWVDGLWAHGLDVGITLPAVLRRTEADCARLSGRRVRLVKGAHRAGPELAHRQPIEIDKAFVRCSKALLRGEGEPSFATHDPRLIEIVGSLAARYGRPRQTFEYALYLGRQQSAQERLLAEGDRVRVYVPYGPDWFERLVGGLAEQPSSIASALRSLLPGAS